MKFALYHDLASLHQKLLSTRLHILLIPLSWLYALGIWIRNRLYALSVFRVQRLPCTVISVGNITVGGTGKTPAVIAIAKHLQEKGIRFAILLRGYKRKARAKVTIVSDARGMLASPREGGDEAYMIAKQLKGIPVLVGRRRYLAGQVALERFGVDVLLLDDGYQHRQLARDIDILTLSATDLFGDPPKLLPAGTLREPPSALRRANIILLTHTNTPNLSVSATETVERLAPNALILESVHQPTRLYSLVSKDRDNQNNIKRLKGKRLLAVCGIGNPASFETTLRRCSAENVELLAFPDHHTYTEKDGRRIYAAFWASKADMIVTTQKDEQKLMQLVGHRRFPIFVLEIVLVIAQGDEKLTNVLSASIRES